MTLGYLVRLGYPVTLGYLVRLGYPVTLASGGPGFR